jgi:hypothetical protein
MLMPEVDSALGFLHCVDVSSVVNTLEVHAAIFRVKVSRVSE